MQRRPIELDTKAVDAKVAECLQQATAMFKKFTLDDLGRVASSSHRDTIDQKQVNMAAYQNYVDYTINMQQAVIADILSGQSANPNKEMKIKTVEQKARADKIEFYIAVLKRTLETGNLAVAVPILSGLLSNAVMQLKKTQQMISDNGKDILAQAKVILDKKNTYKLAIFASHATDKVIPDLAPFITAAEGIRLKDKQAAFIDHFSDKTAEDFENAITQVSSNRATLENLWKKANDVVLDKKISDLKSPPLNDLNIIASALKAEEKELPDVTSPKKSKLNSSSTINLSEAFNDFLALAAAREKLTQESSGIIGAIDIQLQEKLDEKTAEQLGLPKNASILSRYPVISDELTEALGPKNRDQANIFLKDYDKANAALIALNSIANGLPANEKEAVKPIHAKLTELSDLLQDNKQAYNQVVAKETAELAKMSQGDISIKDRKTLATTERAVRGIDANDPNRQHLLHLVASAKKIYSSGGNIDVVMNALKAVLTHHYNVSVDELMRASTPLPADTGSRPSSRAGSIRAENPSPPASPSVSHPLAECRKLSTEIKQIIFEASKDTGFKNKYEQDTPLKAMISSANEEFMQHKNYDSAKLMLTSALMNLKNSPTYKPYYDAVKETIAEKQTKMLSKIKEGASESLSTKQILKNMGATSKMAGNTADAAKEARAAKAAEAKPVATPNSGKIAPPLPPKPIANKLTPPDTKTEIPTFKRK